MNYKEIVNLNFEHQMSKVHCNLFKGDGITEEDLATAKVSYYGFTSVTFSEDGLTGNNEEWITPGAGWEALLLPQNMTGKPFIKVDITLTVNGNTIPKTLIYTPEAGRGQLEAGTFYTFNVTVQKDRLVVQTVTGEWNDEESPEYADEVLRRVNLPEGHGQTLTFSDNVTLKHDNEKNIDYLLVRGKEFSISYEVNDKNSMKGFIPTIEDANKITVNRSQSKNAQSEIVYTFAYKLLSDTASLVYDDYVQVGDVYYSDGTWSRSKIEGKTPIGVVFRAGAAGTDDIPDYYNGWETTRRIRGYVVALTDASTSKGDWANCNTKTVDKNPDYYQYLTTTAEEAKALNNGLLTKYYTGYVNTNKIKNDDPYGLYSLAMKSTSAHGIYAGAWAFKVAVEYDKTVPAPDTSSGWYLPSIRQLVDISNDFGINKCIQEAGGTGFESAIEYWSSTEAYLNGYTYTTLAYTCPIAEMKNPQNRTKYTQYYVRSVLTF